MAERDLTEFLQAAMPRDTAGQWAALMQLSEDEIAEADDYMADGVREMAGHAEDPDGGTTRCLTCGRLDGWASFVAPIYHPSEARGYLSSMVLGCPPVR